MAGEVSSPTTYSSQAAFRARYYSDQPAQDSRGRTYGLFFQDNITIGERFTLTLGLLANRDELAARLMKNAPFKIQF